MSFGLSVGDFILFTTKIAQTLDAIRASDVEVHRQLSLALTNLDSTFRVVERIGLNNFTEEEVGQLELVVRDCTPIIEEVLSFLAVGVGGPSRARTELRRAKWKEKVREGEIDEMAGVLAQYRKIAVVLVMRAESRPWDEIPYVVGFEETFCRRAEAIERAPYKEGILPFSLAFAEIPKPRPCVLIAVFFLTFVALSCFLGVFFTTQKRYGYLMGDAFTLASYVIAVGAFISTAFLASHYSRCKCWKKAEETTAVELDSLSQPVG